MQPIQGSEEDLLFQRAHMLRAKNIQPYARQFARTHTLLELFARYEESQDGEIPKEDEIRVYGRVTAIDFSVDQVEISIEDQNFAMTLVAKEGSLESASMALLRSSVYCGDILGFVVDAVEYAGDLLTVRIKDWRYLALANLPVARRVDIERQRDERHLYWASGLDAREAVQMRSTLITQTRRFMSTFDFLEVTLPYPVPPVDVASQFDRRHKVGQLLVGGIERFYEIGPNLEASPSDWLHHPQALMLRGTLTVASLEKCMRLVEHLIVRVTNYLHTVVIIPWQPFDVLKAGSVARLQPVFEEERTLEIDLSPNWTSRTTRQLILDVLNVDFSPSMSINDALTIAKSELLEIIPSPNWSSGHDVMMAVFYQFVAPIVIQPTFVVHAAQDNSGRDRFELFINGILFAQGQPEVTAPESFCTPGGGDEAAFQLRMLGMSPAVSFEVHLDRLAMLLLNKQDIRDVLV